ncbi:MAG: hypothetical protein KDA46_07855, partial [Parvularculaceae bacterium]|nr:hypothetical protein [Parvularculaceae bacterium]
MTDANIVNTLTSVGADGYVSAEDVLFLRRNVFADGVVSRAELTALFALAEKAPDGDREWADYFAEATTDFFLREEEPQGYLTDAEFSMLKSLVTRDGAKASAIELGLLVSLLEKAVSTPAGMTDFTAEQIRRVVAAMKGGAYIDANLAALVRRFLYAAGGDGAIAVTKDEAELLFDLH